LRTEPFVEGGRDAYPEPDAFVQMPPTQTRRIEKLRYLTAPLAEDTLVAGPIALNFWASIDQDDTNWIIVIKDVGPDVSWRTGRHGELETPELPERELSRGWLKASYRALDAQRTKPWKPWHQLTRKARQKVVPGEVNEYNVEVCSTANLFKAGHRICVEITSMDLPSGSGYGHDCEYVPYHICSSKTTVHKVFHNREYPSHLLLPIIPTSA
jgi:putative CocE/NonD family hydrolase